MATTGILEHLKIKGAHGTARVVHFFVPAYRGDVTPFVRCRAGIILVWEKIAVDLWPLFAGFAIFIVLALFDILPMLPGWIHALVLISLSITTMVYLQKILPKARWPQENEIFRRIEVASDLPHRPLTGLQDYLATKNGGEGAAWWGQHRERLLASIQKLRVGWPRFGLSRYDRRSLRTILILLLFLGYIHSGHDLAARIERALVPSVPPVTTLVSDYKIWITPPAYTGVPQINLSALEKIETLEIPENSELFVQFSGARLAPKVQIDGESQPVAELGDKSYQGRYVLAEGNRLRVALGWQSLGRWDLRLVRDMAPTIQFRNPPGATERATMRLDYSGEDDYGLKTVEAEITKDGEAGEILLELPAQHRKGEPVTNISYHDIAAHPWAGSEVSIRLMAKDDAGHTAYSDGEKFVLPEREFRNPQARLIADMRKALMRGKLQVEDAIDAFSAVLQNPQSYKYDMLATLSLRVAQQRLIVSDETPYPDSIIPLMWDIALRLEDNGLSLAERDMRSLEKALQDAMARGASFDEIENLMNQFERAMGNYLNSMYQQMMQQGMQDLPSLDPSAQSVDVSDIDRLLQQIRQLMRSGNHEEAQKLLSKLQEIMANIKSNPSAANAEAQKKVMEMIKRAQDIIKTQQQSLDATYQAQEHQPQIPKKELPVLQSAQQKIRKTYGAWLKEMKQLGAPPIALLETADGDMGKALSEFSALQKADAKNAKDILQSQAALIQNQTAALEHLRQGLQELMKNMSQNGAQGMAGRAGRTDPFGRTRPGQGVLDDPSIKVPSIPDLQRAQEILDELQRRSGDYSRPTIERDYINRLLRRFD